MSEPRHPSMLPLADRPHCVHRDGLPDHPQQEPHPCPFAEEIHGDAETLCTCCDECTFDCQQDI